MRIVITSGILFALLLLGGCGDPVAPECRTREDCANGGRCVERRCEAPPAPDDAGLEDADAGLEDADAADVDAAERLDAAADVEGDALLLTPEIEVIPTSLDLGDVGLFVSSFGGVTLRNRGFGTLVIDSVTLENPTSQGFHVLTPLELLTELGPGRMAAWTILFRPTALAAGRDTAYSNTLLVATNDLRQPLLRVPLSGVATPRPAACVEFLSAAHSFGYLAVGEVAEALVTVRSCGTEPIQLTELALFGASSGLSLLIPVELPTLLAPGAELPLALTYAPTAPAPLLARLVARTGEGGPTAVFEIDGGPVCPTARIFGTLDARSSVSELAGLSSQPIALDGRGSRDTAGAELEYQWKIAAPASSSSLEITPDLESPLLGLRVDAGGIYTVTLNVRSPITGLLSCKPATFLLDIFPVPAPIEIELSWDAAVDLDLHLLRSETSGAFTPFSYLGPRQVNPSDVFYDNTSPEFGDPDSTWDNPRHGGDSLGEVPERVSVSSLESGRLYKIGVQFALRRGAESANATVSVRMGDRTTRFERQLTEVAAFWVPAFLDGSTGELIEVDRIEPPGALQP